MESILSNDNSNLNRFTLEDTEILPLCIKEVDNNLTINPSFMCYGKRAVQHRGVGFFSNESKGYTYSRQFSKSKPLTESLEKLLNITNNIFKADFNGILVNKYFDGTDYISAHCDDEDELSNIGVVSISYGAVRNFRIRDKRTKKIVKNIPTEPNVFIQMCGDFQKEFTHEIPIQKKIKDVRWSFTFRKHNS